MVGKQEELKWKKVISQYRGSIDLATLFWMWRRFEPELNPFDKLEDIVSFFPEKKLLFIYPRELFGGLLGGGKLKAGRVISAQDIFLTHSGLRTIPSDEKDVFLFDRAAWKNTIDIALNSNSPCRQFDLTWMARYRRDLIDITPFSDYRVMCSNSNTYLMFLEHGIVRSMDDISSIGITSGYAEEELLEGFTPRGIYKSNPIVGDVAYTQAFLNLDEFIDECDKIGYSIPDIFRAPVREGASFRGQVRIVDLSIIFKPDEQFKSLLIAQKIQEYLKYDLDGIKLINQGDVSKIKSTLRSKLDEVFGIQETSLVDHIWILLVPITGCFKRAKGKKLIRHNLIEVVEQFWSSDTDQTWRRDSSADRLSLLKNMGYGANEAKAIRALVTPEALQVSGKPSKKELERYRDQILAKDLSWLKELFL